MAGVTLAQAQARLDGALGLVEKLENGEEARRGDRVLKYSDLDSVLKSVDFWDKRVKDLTNSPDGNFTVRGGVPTDA